METNREEPSKDVSKRVTSKAETDETESFRIITLLIARESLLGNKNLDNYMDEHEPNLVPLFHELKRMVAHILDCKLERDCPILKCTENKNLMQHWFQCVSLDCQVCKLVIMTIFLWQEMSE